MSDNPGDMVRCNSCNELFKNDALWAGHRMKCPGNILAERGFTRLNPEEPLDKLLTPEDYIRAHSWGIDLDTDRCS